MSKDFRHNNFDLIRLVAAVQVMLFHAFTHFNVQAPFADQIKGFVYLLPGVPIFFTISGFLIYQSLERNRDKLKKYFVNRALRIYPALYVCLAFTLLLLIISRELNWDVAFKGSFIAWLFAQLSMFQFYHIPEFDSWGVGRPNGSLWSISVEVQFYLFLPILVLFIMPLSKKKWGKNLLVLGIAALSIYYNIWLNTHLNENQTLYKIMDVFLMKYLYFFCMGILIHLNFDWLKKYLVGKAWFWIPFFILFTLVFRNWLNLFENVYETNVLGLAGEIILSLTTISAAYSAPGISERLLRGNDLSYGIYIYHMPVFNYLMMEYPSLNWAQFITICLSILMIASLSWSIVEKNVLKLKTKIRV
ncbi:acyltransferase [Marinilongibacter aquaticus]|uniref:acyltransferase family protein n=1 Tax=Marinilongibacter aquaticus TaxID=2975157 RepID=UPI0021BDD36B|nr:acyltransferase [Marinilongibacter aquaticus]UBM59735.1 acyltransferase [Marinilongibacter aquaticus]